jgi:hypothetical protein
MSTTPNDPSLSAPEAWALPPQPLSTSQVINRLFELLRQNFRLFLTIGIVPFGAIFVAFIPYFIAIFRVSHPLHPELGVMPTDPSYYVLLAGSILLMVAASAIFYGLFESAATWAALRIDAGATATASQAWQVAWNQAGRSIWLMILRCIVAFVPAYLAILLGLVSLFASMTAAGGSYAHPGAHPGAAFLVIPLGILLGAGGLVYCILAVIWLGLSYPASVTEDLSAWKSIRRSARLTRGARGRIFLTGFVLCLIGMVVFMVFEIVAVILCAIGVFLFATFHLAPVYGYIGIGLGVLVFVPLLLMLYSVFYVSISLYLSIIYRDQRRLEQTWMATLAPTSGAPALSAAGTTANNPQA